MAITLVVETGAGLHNANSYVSLDAANEYNANHPHADTWQTVGTEDKKRAILLATRLLDSEVEWHGTPVKNTDTSVVAGDRQRLRWPRSGAHDLDGNAVNQKEIPEWLKEATSELARHVANTDRTAEPETRGYSRMEVGDLKVDIDKTDTPPVLPRSVVHMISPYGDVRYSHAVKLRRT